jgi:hypothetical protein
MPNENTQKIEQTGSAQEYSEEASGSYSRLQQTYMEISRDRPRTKEHRLFWRRVMTIEANLPKKSRRSGNEVKKMLSAMEAMDIERPVSEAICALTTTRIAASEKAPLSRRQLAFDTPPLTGCCAELLSNQKLFLL